MRSKKNSVSMENLGGGEVLDTDLHKILLGLEWAGAVHNSVINLKTIRRWQ